MPVIDVVFIRFDVLQKKLRPTIASRTKVACIVGAALLLIAIPGLYFQIQAIAPPIGLVLVIIPLVINILGMIVILILIGCMKTSLKKLADANRKKQRYVRLLPSFQRPPIYTLLLI